ncbi:hypothetical protein XELAEV_18045470mg [Xenopus laevis]|uniref:Uncharacterized protein n=1 Tax=Xenopus laevis TaxID=8355 RepID=A0A974H490_XENLA|nr:hypothetical protein XELAEV_18045470mg [Xenopus laevis]
MHTSSNILGNSAFFFEQQKLHMEGRSKCWTWSRGNWNIPVCERSVQGKSVTRGLFIRIFTLKSKSYY